MNDSSTSTPATHPVTWTDEKVARFWNAAVGIDAIKAVYFSRLVGRGIVEFLRRATRLQGRVLDYGCGPGYLIEHLLAAGVAAEGVDFSSESVAAVNQRFTGRAQWRGALTLTGDSLPYPDGSFDLVICLETIEHVLPERLDRFLAEFRRILKPSTGRLFITTPNAEDLGAGQVCCPECGSVFHRMQHVRSFTHESLAALMEAHGFSTQLCEVTDFDRYQARLWPGLLDLSPRRLARLAVSTGCRLADALSPRRPGRWVEQYFGEGQNLFWLGGRNR